MNKLILIVLITTITNATYWSVGMIANEGLNSKIECKNGYLIDVIYGVYRGHDIYIEQSHCTDRSGWDGDCIHSAIPCMVKERL